MKPTNISFTKYVSWLLLVILPVLAFTQSESKKDSLLQLLNSRKHDSTKVLIFTQLSKEYQAANIDSAYYFINEALLLSKELDFDHGLAESYASLGDLEVIMDNLDKAKDSYLKSIEYFKHINKKSDLTQVYIVLGNIFLTQDNYFNALQYYNKGVEIAEEINFEGALEYLYSNLGITYTQIENFEKALEFLQKALEVSKKSNNQNNIASIFINIGSIYYSQNDFQLAKTYYDKARTLSIENDIKSIESNSLISIGEIYEREKEYDLALEYFKNSIDVARQIDDQYKGPKSILFARSYSNLGYIYFNKKNYNEAIKYLEMGYDLAEESGQLKLVRNNAEKLSLAYEKLYQTDSALKYSRIYKVISDSVLNKDIIKKIAKVELQNEFDQQLKEKELEQTKKDAIQKRKELIYITIASLSILFLLVFVLLYLLLKNKVKRVRLNEKNLLLEKETLQKELEYKNKELTTNVMYLLKKNEFILNITEKLKVAKMGFKVENKKIADDIIRELESSLSQDTWKEFELRFQEVHTDFYNRLNNLYPDLSPNDQKLCAFLRLNMTTKEIATITYLSVNSINIARHRLRKKLNIEHEENLISFLSQL
jgi:tetratricopeptide (TPR) repeat protein/DNA-binding CsgD family transcriptional regulator